MREYKPMQRRSDGRWDYTCNGYPTGYCCGFREWTEEDRQRVALTDEYIEKHNSQREKHHTHGHETEQEACECYKNYLLDNELSLDHEDSGQQRKCAVCGEWTIKFAVVAFYKVFHLCDQHRNRESVAQVMPQPRVSWQ